MKKAIYFTLGLIILSFLTNAGNPDSGKGFLLAPLNKDGKCFDENTRVINVGIGLGYSYYSYNTGPGSSVNNLPTISVSYEQPWSKRFGPGLMGIGGYLAYKGSSWKQEYSDNLSTYKYKEVNNSFIIASRAMYHWDGLNSDKAEVYGGVILGVRVATSHYTSEYGGNAALYNSNSDNSSVSFDVAYSLVAGARYYFKPNIAVFGEASFGISYLTIGLSFKL